MTAAADLAVVTGERDRLVVLADELRRLVNECEAWAVDLDYNAVRDLLDRHDAGELEATAPGADEFGPDLDDPRYAIHVDDDVYDDVWRSSADDPDGWWE